MTWRGLKHFKREEWGKDPTRANFRLTQIMDRLRELSDSPIQINVCYDDSGHSPKSYHKTGDAVDFVFLENLSYILQYFYISMFPELRGIGFYPDWHTPGWHVDLRPEFLRWVRIDGIYSYNKDNFIREIIK